MKICESSLRNLVLAGLLSIAGCGGAGTSTLPGDHDQHVNLEQRVSAAPTNSLARNEISPSCPQGVGLGDGCPITLSGTYQQTTFFTGYAQQSGQAWVNPRPSWNVAGVDYPEVSCGHANNADFENFDFCGDKTGAPPYAPSGHGAVYVVLSGGQTGTVKFINNNFCRDMGSPNTLGPSVGVNPNASDIVFQHNTFSGYSTTLSNDGQATGAFGTYGIHVIVQYNAFIDIPSRIDGATYTKGFQFDHNLIDGFMQANTSVHGEITAGLATSGTVDYVNYQYNTILIPGSNKGEFSTPFYISNGIGGSTTLVTDTKIDHNIIDEPSGYQPSADALASFGYQNYGTAEIDHNYLDNTGNSFGFVVVCGNSDYYSGATVANPVLPQTLGPITWSSNFFLNSTTATYSVTGGGMNLIGAGSGYVVNDVIYFSTDGATKNSAQITVKTIGSGGSILSFYINNNGAANRADATPLTGFAGSGTGALWGQSCRGY
jgi:hypothetical protein